PEKQQAESVALLAPGSIKCFKRLVQRFENDGVEFRPRFLVPGDVRKIEHAAQPEKAVGGCRRDGKLLLQPSGQSRKVLQEFLIHHRLANGASARYGQAGLDVAAGKALLDRLLGRLLQPLEA